MLLLILLTTLKLRHIWRHVTSWSMDVKTLTDTYIFILIFLIFFNELIAKVY